MNKFKKLFKFSAKLCVTILIVGIVAWGVILEPQIKINGFASLNTNKLYVKQYSLTLMDDEENIINNDLQLHYEQTNINEVPKMVKDAFISVEDKRFYQHNGIDYIRLASAFKNNLKSLSYSEGGSTITQQLIKNTHLSNEKRLSRKFQEMRIAIDLERKYTKDEILEAYLNIVYFGNNIYGLKNASKLMFDKDMHSLTVSEGALLAGIINNPSRFNPYTKPKNAIKRRNLVLSRMLNENKISLEEYNYAISESLNLKELSRLNSSYYNNIINEVAKILNCNEKDVLSQKLIIGTNIDVLLQKSAEKALSEVQIDTETLAQVIIINNLSGNIVSVCTNTPMNLSQSKRQPGSIIKPFVSYAPALEKNLIVPSTPIKDEKMTFDEFEPSNYKDKYEGWTTIKRSLTQSSNICAVKLLEINGVSEAKKVAENFGLSFHESDDSLVLALGSMHEGLTLSQITNAYQVFANNGCYIEASCIDYIKTSDGKLLYKRKIYEKDAVSAETAFFMNEMLNECTRSGTAKRLSSLKNICAKTGTVGDENGNTDAYCVAYSPTFTVGVWLGSVDYTKRIKNNGGGIPTLIAQKILSSLANDASFSKPNTIIEAEIDVVLQREKHKLVSPSASTPIKNRKIENFTEKTLPKKS